MSQAAETRKIADKETKISMNAVITRFLHERSKFLAKRMIGMIKREMVLVSIRRIRMIKP